MFNFKYENMYEIEFEFYFYFLFKNIFVDICGLNKDSNMIFFVKMINVFMGVLFYYWLILFLG